MRDFRIPKNGVEEKREAENHLRQWGVLKLNSIRA